MAIGIKIAKRPNKNEGYRKFINVFIVPKAISLTSVYYYLLGNEWWAQGAPGPTGHV